MTTKYDTGFEGAEAWRAEQAVAEGFFKEVKPRGKPAWCRIFKFRALLSPNQGRLCCGCALLFALLTLPVSHGENYGEGGTILVEASVAQNPPAIDLHWPVRTDIVSYNLIIRAPNGMETSLNLAGSSSGYHDTHVVPGLGYEYRLRANRVAGSSPLHAYSNLFSAIDLALVESRGRVILVIDQNIESTLNAELGRWEQDVSSSGWTVERLSVAPSTLPREIRNAIRARATAWPAGTEGAVFLLGHVPVPYSGNIYPDGHLEHRGAWPCDGYYGELNSVWTDNTINNQAAVRQQNWNLSADRKFDAGTFPSAVELMVGRVDFSNLPCFSLGETELLRRYLNKDHAFRAGMLSVERRAVIDDNFASILSESPSCSSRFAMAGCVGAASMTNSGLVSGTVDHPCLIGLGCGYGDYQNIFGICSSSSCSLNPPQTVLALVFGSFFGDFDNGSNLLRSLLAADNCTLATAWTGRPQWQMHHLAMNFPLGYAARLTQNSASYSPYNTGYFAKSTHVALMGDPTLTLFHAKPVSNVAANGGAVTWSMESSSTLMGFCVYRAQRSTGPWLRGNASLLSDLHWTDPSPVLGGQYMVRAVHRETTASGTFLNASLGVLAEIDPQTVSVSIRVIESQAKEFPPQPAMVRIERDASGSALTVTLCQPAGTATENVDYEMLPRQVTIPEGARFSNLQITPRADNEREGEEDVTVTILAIEGAQIDSSHASATIHISDHPWQAWCNTTFTSPQSFIADTLSESPETEAMDDSTMGDPDQDGITNLMEFALGTDPLIANASPALLSLPGSSKFYLGRYTRCADIPGLEWHIETSQNLVTWMVNPSDVTETILSATSTMETCELRQPINSLRAFMRMQVVTEPGFFVD